MAFFGLCKRRIQKWRFFNFPAPPRGFLQKKGQKWQKMAKNDLIFDLFLGQKVPGFQGFGLKNEGQKWPCLTSLRSVSRSKASNAFKLP